MFMEMDYVDIVVIAFAILGSGFIGWDWIKNEDRSS